MFKRRGRRPSGRYEKAGKQATSRQTGIQGPGKYGLTWWGKQWLNAFTHISDENRLPRGRTYANNGSVREINIDGSRVSAQVQGTYLYKVHIAIPAFTPAQKDTVGRIVEARPELLSRLLNRELPEELDGLCLQEGVRLFPDSWRAFKAECSCPDWAMPCKHLAAVIYLIGAEIDKDPFWVFRLHDFDLIDALQQKGLSVGQGVIQIPAMEALRIPMDDVAHSGFYPDPGLLQTLDFSLIPELRDNLLSILSDAPLFFPKGNFKDLLKKALDQAGREAKKAVQAMPADPETDERRYRAARVVECTLNAWGMPLFFGAWDAEENEVFQTDQAEAWIAWLSGVPAGSLAVLPDDLRAHWLAWRFAVSLLARGAVVPCLYATGQGRYRVHWQPALLDPAVRELFHHFEALVPRYVVNYQPEKNGPLMLVADEHRALALLSVYLDHHLFQHNDIRNQHGGVSVVDVFFTPKPTAFSDFKEQSYAEAIAAWLHPFHLSSGKYIPVLEIHELEPAAFEVSLLVEEKGNAVQAPVTLQALFEEETYAPVRLSILRDLATLGAHFPDLNKLLADKGRVPLRYPASGFADILLRTLPVIRLFGIRVMLPKALSRLLRPKATLRLDTDSGKVLAGSAVSLQQMLRYRWQVAMGDEAMEPEAFLELLKHSKGLVKIRDEYVYLDEKETRALADKLTTPPDISGPRLLQIALAEEYDGAPVWLSDQLKAQIRALTDIDLIAPPGGLTATLRPYQHRGYSWLCKNARIGIGSILADDMGLGKTLQVITTLLHFKEQGLLNPGRRALAVVPTTLLGNWERETARFAPGLHTAIYHGPGRSLDQTAAADLVLTSYGVARSDADKLGKHSWYALVIDEAQNIKNPAAEVSKAVKKIPADTRIALSGTPVENRLSEYWSVFDFTNKGYLGGLKAFREDFAIPIEGQRDQYAARRFQRVTRPFVLRRAKTDKSIISDLPDKIEHNHYCALSPEQAALYQGVVDQTMEKIENTEGIERRGLVLSLIMMLKQICNHPAHYLKKGPAQPEHSGKCPLLLDLIEEATVAGEKTLVFTQFREMGELLIPMIRQRLGVAPAFLHGGVSRKGRDAMVADFQLGRDNPVLLLSLKAGGTGLNLTAASQVIHFDLWWNPAVEAQATDRAYRIGQHRNVQVRRFITAATFEERIDKMIQQKKELADMTVTGGETWIGELSNKELREVLRLGS